MAALYNWAPATQWTAAPQRLSSAKRRPTSLAPSTDLSHNDSFTLTVNWQ
jgi:hypothetical protein